MSAAPAPLAVTWWGHSSVTLELGGVRVTTDPLLSRRLLHLRRDGPLPTWHATDVDMVLVSHLHRDHLHLPSLRRFPRGTPIVVPRGARAAVPGLGRLSLVEVAPGETHHVAGARIEVLPARHDGRRHPLARRSAPALGFRLSAGGWTCWYPGDTGPSEQVGPIDPVDLAVVPIGGWGPTLGETHLDPAAAAHAVAHVGASWSLPVHYGTFWPMTMRHVSPRTYAHLFVDPPRRFRRAIATEGVSTVPITPAFGERCLLPVARRGGP